MFAPRQQLSPSFDLPLTALRRAGPALGMVLVADQATKALAHQVASPAAPGWLQPVHNADVLLSMYSGTRVLLVVVALAFLIGFSVHLTYFVRGGFLPAW